MSVGLVTTFVVTSTLCVCACMCELNFEYQIVHSVTVTSQYPIV